jgi:four helix bundle protein
MRQFTSLRVWAQGHALAIQIYRATDPFPARERNSLASQLRRAATSIPTNLAEGSKRLTNRDFAHFINIAEGSAAEVEYLSILCRDLGLLSAETATALAKESQSLQKRLCALRMKLV